MENNKLIQLSGDDEKDIEFIENLNDQLRGITPLTVPVKEILRIVSEYAQKKPQNREEHNDPSRMNNTIGKNITEEEYNKYREKIMKERDNDLKA